MRVSAREREIRSLCLRLLTSEADGANGSRRERKEKGAGPATLQGPTHRHEIIGSNWFAVRTSRLPCRLSLQPHSSIIYFYLVSVHSFAGSAAPHHTGRGYSKKAECGPRTTRVRNAALFLSLRTVQDVVDSVVFPDGARAAKEHVIRKPRQRIIRCPSCSAAKLVCPLFYLLAASSSSPIHSELRKFGKLISG